MSPCSCSRTPHRATLRRGQFLYPPLLWHGAALRSGRKDELQNLRGFASIYHR